MERLSAEGKFFHRSCFKCEYCATTLRLSSYAYDIEDGKRKCLFVRILLTVLEVCLVVSALSSFKNSLVS